MYKLHFCTTCTAAYCYGVLWRAFDMMPQAVMEQEHWECPKCLKICNCGACRQSGNTVPYVPKNTLLGHDTRPIADDRSVESIVDFRVHNLGWLKAAGEENRSKDSKRMNRLREQADAEKAKDPLASLEADDGPRELDAALQDSVMNGYGDQSHIVNSEPQENSEHHDQLPASHSEPGSQVGTADMSGLQDGEGESVYPDPSDYPDPTMLDRGRMMGMGFYEQDESTDRILFDAFQMPTADALNNEPQISDFVKKTLRLAKRKARLEQDDDPDFRGPKSHRKKPRTGNIEQLVNLDPALLGSLGDNTPTPTREMDSIQPTTQVPDGAAEQNGGQETETETSVSASASASAPTAQTKKKRPPLPIDPLRPTLRHAKPMTSYVEADAEDLLDDADDAVPEPGMIFRAENSVLNQEPGLSSVDLAADAVRAITGAPVAPIAQNASKNAQSTPQHTSKRRGRPPRSSLGATSASPATETKPSTGTRRRGRPPGTGRGRRSILSHVESVEDTDMADAEDHANDHAGAVDAEPSNVTVDELEAQLAEELGPPQDDDEAQPEYTPSQRVPMRRRGRPPGSRRSQPATASPAVPEDVPEPTKDLSSMSMAERMALKGKKIRIGQRATTRGTGGSVTATPTRMTPRTVTRINPQKSDPSTTDTDADEPMPTPRRGRAELLEEDFESPAAEGSPSVSSASEHDSPPPAPAPRVLGKPGGPTVVRLAFSDDESSADSVDSADDSVDDEIPAQRITSTRGRGRGRGRGSRWTTLSRT
jgi:hypothetical protein